MGREPTARRRLVSRPALAWALALGQILMLAQAVAFFGWSGVWSAPEIAVPGVMAFAAVGALIASQRVRNRLGWLLLLVPLPVTLNVMTIEYADVSVLHHVSLPFVTFALWVVNWGWTPFVGSFPVILVRFPDGRVARRWRFVDVLAFAGTLLLAVALGITGAIPGNNAFASGPLPSAAGVLLVAGLGMLALAMVGAVASLTERYRHGDRKLRSQLKWILLAAIVVSISTVYMAVVEVVFRIPFGDAMLPSTVVLVFIPLAIGVAVLHNQLFDIDVIINRTLVYVMLTGILGGLYIGVIELVQRVFVLYTGETSNTAIVITAFIVAGAFTPIQKWIDAVVERRFGGGDVAGRVDRMSSSVHSVVRVIDPHRVARWLLDELVEAFDSEGGALYLRDHDASRPFHARGRYVGTEAVEVAIRHDGTELGRLVLGRRRGGVDYSHRDLEALNAAAGSLAEAIVVASALGHLALPTAAATHVDGAATREPAGLELSAPGGGR